MKKILLIVSILIIATVTATCAEVPPPLEGWDLPMIEKAEFFEKELHELLDADGMVLSDIRVFTEPDGTTYKTAAYSDSAYWTGNYLLGECLRYAVTGDPEAKKFAEASARALVRMTKATGIPGLLVRGYLPQRYEEEFRMQESHHMHTAPDGPRFKELVKDGIFDWQKVVDAGFAEPDGRLYLSLDVSIDQLMGAMQGLHFAYRFVADDELKKEIAAAVSDVLDYLMKNDYNIIDVDGEETTWGVFEPGRIQSNLHALLTLSIFRIGYYMTGERRHLDAYEYLRMDSNFGAMSRTAKFTAIQNWSDDAMEFMAYVNLLMAEDDPEARKDFLMSLKRSWKAVKYHDKPFFNFVVAHYFEKMPGRDEVIKRGVDFLKVFPTNKHNRTVDYCSYEREDKRYPNPPHYRPPEGYYWTADITRCSHVEPEGREKISSGNDFILAYWLGRYWGFIEE